MKLPGAVLRKLREINGLTLRQASVKLDRSVGWISEAENDNPRVALTVEEFERIVKAYDGEKHRSNFCNWVRHGNKTITPVDQIVDGSIFGHLRIKAYMGVKEASGNLQMSVGKLCNIEAGRVAVSEEDKRRIMALYGYSEGSFKNFKLNGSRAKSVSMSNRLKTVLHHLREEEMKQVFDLALSLLRNRSETVESKPDEAVPLRLVSADRS